MSVAELPAGTHLAYALVRKTSRRGQIGCTAFLALFLGAVGFAILRLALAHPEEPDNWIVYTVGGGFALVAVLLALAAIHQAFALATPQTKVEVASATLERGQRARFYFEQPGPARFESLRANLVGEASWYEGTGKRRNRKVDHLGTFNFFDSGAFVVENASIPFQGNGVLDVPADVLPSGYDDRRREITWAVEVWGRVKGRADVQHVFPVEVR